MARAAAKSGGADFTRSVDEYIARHESQVQRRLVAIRKIVQKLAPDAEEGFSYGMPAYKLGGRPLVYFAAFERHIGLYALPKAHAALDADLANYKRGKGSVQFPHDEKLPLALIRKLVAARLAEVEGA